MIVMRAALTGTRTVHCAPCLTHRVGEFWANWHPPGGGLAGTLLGFSKRLWKVSGPTSQRRSNVACSVVEWTGPNLTLRPRQCHQLASISATQCHDGNVDRDGHKLGTCSNHCLARGRPYRYGLRAYKSSVEDGNRLASGLQSVARPDMVFFMHRRE